MKLKTMMKKILIIFLIITLSTINFIFVGTNAVLAIYEELENQSTNIENTNVIFDVYLKNSESKVHSKQSKISEGEKIYINVKILNTGVLDDAKVKFDNSTFLIDENNLNNENIKSINNELGEIELNQISSNREIEIEVPIKFNKQAQIVEEDFNREIDITLSGKYINQKTKTISKTIKTQIMWTDDVNIQVSQNIEKYTSLGEQGVLLQEKIVTNVENNILPRKNEKLTIKVPEIGTKPEQVTVLLNGIKLEDEKYNYNIQNGILEINNQYIINQEGKTDWENSTNEYKIIYVYKNLKEIKNTQIMLYTNIETEIYTKEDVYTADLKEEKQISNLGNVVSLEQYITKSQYKGYMYFKSEDETTYKNTYKLEISDVSSVQDIIINQDKSVFIDEQGVEYDTNNSTYNKMLKINRTQLFNIIGEEGTLNIFDEIGSLIATIDKNTETLEDGNIEIKIQNIDKIKIYISKPQNEGSLSILIEKAIRGNTEYTKQQLELVKGLKESSSVLTTLGTETKEQVMELKETSTKAKLDINTDTLSTLEDNENIQITATLLSNLNEFDLYKNPSIQIILPAEVEKITDASMNKLYADNMRIDESKIIDNPDGTKTINIKLQGEQKEYLDDISQGIQIIIKANMKLKKDTPTKTSEIKMIYTNENSKQIKYEEKVQINIKSKDGILLYSEVSGYDESGQTIESINGDTKEKEITLNNEERIVTNNIYLINNYQNQIDEGAIVGAITDKAILEEGVTTNIEGAQVYYSEYSGEGDIQWKTDKENAKIFKVVVPENKLDVGQVLKLQYKFKIPHGIKDNEIISTITKAEFNNNQQKESVKSQINLINNIELPESNFLSEEIKTGVTKDIDGVAINSTAYIVNDDFSEIELKNGENVKEGQNVKYILTLTNKTSQDLQNIKVKALNKNTKIYDLKYVEIVNPDADTEEEEETLRPVYDELDTNEKEFTNIDILKAGASVELVYRAVVTESTGDNKQDVTIKIDENSEKTETFISNNIESSELKLNVNYFDTEDLENFTSGVISYRTTIQNLSDNTLNDVIAEIKFSDKVEFLGDGEDEDTIDYFVSDSEIEFLGFKDNVLKVKIKEIKPYNKDDEETAVVIKSSPFIKDIPFEQESVLLSIVAKANTSNDTYTSNIYYREALQGKKDISIKQSSNISESHILKTGDKAIIKIEVNNNTDEEQEVTILETLPDIFVIDNAKISIGNSNINFTDEIEHNAIEKKVSIPAKTVAHIIIETTLDCYLTDSDETEFSAAVRYGYETVESNALKYKVQVDEEDDDDDDDNNGGNGDNEVGTYVISGTIWNDENRNGERDAKEKGIAGVQVRLLNADTGDFAKDKNGNTYTYITSNEGKYSFSILPGNYMVAVFYDIEKYSMTEYQKNGVSSNSNSDFINKSITVNGTQLEAGITDKITIKKDSAKNIDAGLIEKQKFNLSIDKQVKKITAQNSKGTTVKEYQNSNLAKMEIRAKEFAGTTIVIEYSITVKNTSEVAGYANDIVDIIPTGYKFSSNMNKDWYTDSNGQLHNTSLANEKIEAGESKTLNIILTKTLTNNDEGIVVNTAKIEKASGVLNTPEETDKDNISNAQALISVSTGAKTIIYSIIIISIVGLIIISIFIYRKRRNLSD